MIVLLIILLIIALLVNQYAAFEVKYIGGKLEYNVKYSFLKLYSNVSERKKKKKEKKVKPEKISAKKEKKHDKKEKENIADVSDIEDNEADKAEGNKEKSGKKQKKPKRSFDDILEQVEAILDFVRASQKHIFNLVRNIRFSKINIDFLIADTDACDCAIRYGAVSAGIYNIIGFLSAYFKTTVDNLNIGLKYNNNKSVYDFSFQLRLKLGTAITSALGILFAYFRKGRVKKKSKEKNPEKLSEECMKMSKDHAVNGLMGTTIEKIREMIDVNTIIGNPITTPEGATIIPVSKVSFGFASGGSDIPSKSQKELFGGGAGAGVSVQPLAFICVSPNGDTKLLQMSVNAKKENAIINTIPELIDKISDMVSSKGKGTGKKEVKETVTEQTVVVEE